MASPSRYQRRRLEGSSNVSDWFRVLGGLLGHFSSKLAQSNAWARHWALLGYPIFHPMLLLTGNVSFSNTTLGEITVMIVLQSFVIDILAMVLFNYAVQLLGAAFAALTSIFALLGGITLLGETVTPLEFLGVILVASGIFLASSILNKFQPTTQN